VRLQKALASAGFGSRRQCEELILEGRIEVDGKIVEQLGTSIDWSTSKVFVDGTPLKPRRLVYYIVNKPTGVVTTNADPEGRPRVIDLVPPEERVFPVGRLDRSSEGLILLTNDGELAQHLAHPKYEVQKVYRVTVAGNVQADTLRQMHQGIYIAEGHVKVEGAKVLKARPRATEMEITLKEGKNREIRRILARLGHKVQTLKRIAIGPLRLGEMPTGAYRRLSAEEIRKLKQSTQATATGGETPERPKKAARGADGRPSPKGGERRPTTARPGGAAAPGGKAGARDGKRKTAAQSAFGKRPTTKRASGKGDDVAPRIRLPGLTKRRSGVVIGAESPAGFDAAPVNLPIELVSELPQETRNSRSGRDSRTEAESRTARGKRPPKKDAGDKRVGKRVAKREDAAAEERGSQGGRQGARKSTFSRKSSQRNAAAEPTRSARPPAPGKKRPPGRRKKGE
jgi:23S rRNA pseudouridine2605 synthase